MVHIKNHFQLSIIPFQILHVQYICKKKHFIFYIDKIKDFLNEFEIDTADGYKASKYVKQLVKKKTLSLN